MTKPHVKLHIPGPVEVSADTFCAMSQPMIGHRGTGFQDLYANIQPKLRQVLNTQNPVFLSTSSAWGVMEAAVRNLVGKKVLNCCCGAFSDKWLDVSKRCGKEAEALKVDWGRPILPEQIDAKLKTGQFDAITLVHNETSTGVMNPLADIAAVMKKYPDVMFVVDTVSSMTAIKIDTDALGIDVMLAGVQKAWALPPGLAIFAVSDRALKKAETIPGRGYYFDFLEFKANHDKNMTPSTVGHEIDFTISDFVADLRAPTPSAAAELVAKAKQEVEAQIADYRRRLDKDLRLRIAETRQRLTELSQHYVFRQPAELIRQYQQQVDDLQHRLALAADSGLGDRHARLDALAGKFKLLSPQARLERWRDDLANTERRFAAAFARQFQTATHRLANAQAKLDLLSPKSTLERGYSITRLADGRIVKSVKAVKAGDTLTTLVADGAFKSTVEPGGNAA